MTVAVVFSFSRGALLGLAAAGGLKLIVRPAPAARDPRVLGSGRARGRRLHSAIPERSSRLQGQGERRAGEHRTRLRRVGGRAVDRRAAGPRRRPGQLPGHCYAGDRRPAGTEQLVPGPQRLPRRRHGDSAWSRMRLFILYLVTSSAGLTAAARGAGCAGPRARATVALVGACLGLLRLRAVLRRRSGCSGGWRWRRARRLAPRRRKQRGP